MGRRLVFVPEIGEILLVKSRRSKHIRLSVTANGQVRVSMPSWTPYGFGLAFARQRRGWIQQQLIVNKRATLQDGSRVGATHTLHFQKGGGSVKITTRITKNSIWITTGLPFDNHQVQLKAKAACERALSQEASQILPKRLEELAAYNSFEYRSVKIRKLISRWGSCSASKDIVLSYFLIQLPEQLIDYVILHELVHTAHLNHGKDFWARFQEALPKARDLQKEIRAYKPRIEASFSSRSEGK